MTAKEVQDAAELEVRRYFDYYLEKTHPKIMKEHFHSCKHGILLTKFKWVMLGMAGTFILLVPTLGRGLVIFIMKLLG